MLCDLDQSFYCLSHVQGSFGQSLFCLHLHIIRIRSATNSDHRRLSELHFDKYFQVCDIIRISLPLGLCNKHRSDARPSLQYVFDNSQLLFSLAVTVVSPPTKYQCSSSAVTMISQPTTELVCSDRAPNGLERSRSGWIFMELTHQRVWPSWRYSPASELVDLDKLLAQSCSGQSITLMYQ